MIHGTEVVHDVPSVGPKLLAFQHHRMEEADSEKQPLDPLGLLVFFDEGPVHTLVIINNSVLDALGLLEVDLDSFLQYADGELLEGHQT